jgi:hypothetical protein
MEALLDRTRERRRVGQPEPARKLCGRHAARQLQQRQRVAARLRDDPVADSLVDRPADRRAEEGPRVSGAQTVDHQLGQDVELRAAVAHGEHQGNGLRERRRATNAST